MSIADELITRGWTQGNYEHTPTGRVCLLGAANAAITGWAAIPHGVVPSEEQYAEARVVLRALRMALGLDPDGKHGDVMEWNDAPERTFDEVLRVAKEADEILDGI